MNLCAFFVISNYIKIQVKAQVKTQVKTQVKALKSKGDLSIAEIASAIGYAQITTTLKNIIKELKTEGKAEQTRPDKPHSQKQKIHLK